MATKNLKRVLRHIYKQNPEFDPANYTVNWDKARKYIVDKDKRMTYNNRFRPLYKVVKKEMREEGCHNKEVNKRAKQKVKNIIKNETN